MPQYPGKPRHAVPSHRYDIFLTFFEKKVHALQQEVENMRRAERIYNIAREELEKAKLPNDIRLDTRGECVDIDIHITEENHWKHFLPLIEALGKRVRPEDPVPAFSGVSTATLHWYWSKECNTILYVTAFIPWKGTKFCRVDTITETRQDTKRKFIWSDKPWAETAAKQVGVPTDVAEQFIKDAWDEIPF